MQTNDLLDWTKFATVLRSIAVERLEQSSNLTMRGNSSAASQERIVGELLRSIAIAIDAAHSNCTGPGSPSPR